MALSDHACLIWIFTKLACGKLYAVVEWRFLVLLFLFFTLIFYFYHFNKNKCTINSTNYTHQAVDQTRPDQTRPIKPHQRIAMTMILTHSPSSVALQTSS